MNRTFAAFATAAILTAGAAVHGAHAQDAEIDVQQVSEDVAAQTLAVSAQLSASFEAPSPLAERIASLGDADMDEPAPVLMAETADDTEAEPVRFAFAD